MLDELLGRTELKERIAQLEEERERLQRRLEAEEDRRRTAVRDRQTADERANDLEDKIAELEGRLAHASTSGQASTPAYHRSATLGPERASEVLRRISSLRTDEEGALSAYISDGSDPHHLADVFGEDWELVVRAAPCLVYADDARLVGVLLDPPLPPAPFVTWDDRFRIEREWVVPSGRFALALVRSDLFAIGEYEDDERLDMEGFRSDVKEGHSKGGFSQARFERRRDAQIDEHLERCREAIDGREADRLIVVGERTVLSPFRSDAIATAAVDATGSPDDALTDAFRAFWRTQLHVV